MSCTSWKQKRKAGWHSHHRPWAPGPCALAVGDPPRVPLGSSYAASVFHFCSAQSQQTRQAQHRGRPRRRHHRGNMGRKSSPGALELAEEEARTCCGCRFPLLLALLQLALGIAVTVLGFLMASISPSLLVRDTPFWAGIIVSIESVRLKHQRACQPHGGVETNPAACTPHPGCTPNCLEIDCGHTWAPQSKAGSRILAFSCLRLLAPPRDLTQSTGEAL